MVTYQVAQSEPALRLSQLQRVFKYTLNINYKMWRHRRHADVRQEKGSQLASAHSRN